MEGRQRAGDEARANTGMAVILLEESGQNRIVIFTGANDETPVDGLDAAPVQEVELEKFAGLTILTPNETETRALVGVYPQDVDTAKQAADALRERCACTYVVLKMGEKGCFISGEGIEEMVPTFPVTAKDPTAAGDCFTGVLVSKFVELGDIKEAARYANAAAGLSVQELGAQPSLPTEGAVKEFLAQQG